MLFSTQRTAPGSSKIDFPPISRKWFPLYGTVIRVTQVILTVWGRPSTSMVLKTTSFFQEGLRSTLHEAGIHIVDLRSDSPPLNGVFAGDAAVIIRFRRGFKNFECIAVLHIAYISLSNKLQGKNELKNFIQMFLYLFFKSRSNCNEFAEKKE